MIGKLSAEAKNAIIIEDSSSWQDDFKRILKDSGWVIVGQATNLDDALELIKKLGELKVSLVLVDGILSQEIPKNMRATYTAEGGKVAKEIKKNHPDITILGVSGNQYLQKNDPNVTKHIGKELRTIIPAIREIS